MRIFFQASLFRVMCPPNNGPVRTVLIDHKLYSASAICFRDNMIMSHLLVSEWMSLQERNLNWQATSFSAMRKRRISLTTRNTHLRQAVNWSALVRL